MTVPKGPMRFSIFSVIDHHPKLPRTLDGFYGELMQQIELADQLGYESFWLAEHHFHEYGVVPNPAVFLAAAAARTRRIRLGPAVAVLPFRSPLLVAEDYAMVDRISNGRLWMGVGSGYLKHEYAGFGADPERKREVFDDYLALLKRAWAGDKVRFGGNEVVLNVLPQQRPHPPIYVAALRAEVTYYVGRQGHRLLCVPYASVDNLAGIGPMIEGFRKGLREGGHREGDDSAIVALHTYVAETDEAARRDAAEAFDLYVATRLYARAQVYDDILRSRLGLFGSVETVVQQLIDLHGFGVRHVMLLMNFGALAAPKVEASMRRVVTEVAPRLAARLAAAAE